jgi:hypothetical protein
MITPDKQKFILINAPNNPVGLQQALGGESTVKLSPTGDVLMRLSNLHPEAFVLIPHFVILECNSLMTLIFAPDKKLK